MKKVKMLGICLLILTSCFIGFIGNDVIFDEIKDLGSTIDILGGSSNDHASSNQTQESLTSQSMYQTSTPSDQTTPANEWQEGTESIHVVYDLPNAYITDYNLQIWGVSGSATYNDPLSVSTTGRISDTHDVTVYSWYAWSKDDPSDDPDEYAGAILVLEIQALTSGTLYFDFDLKIDGVGSDVTPISVDSTQVINKTNIDNDGFLRVQMSYYAYMLTSDTCYLGMDIVSGASTIEIYDSGPVTHYAPDIFKVGLKFDEFYYVRNDIEEDIRTKSRYSDSNFEQQVIKMDIENWEFNTEIDVYTPNYLEFASIAPTATITENADYYSITDTIPVTYELLLTTNASKQYSAVYKTSGYYFANPGFEGDWDYDWANTSSDEWTADLITGIVYRGAFALNLTSPSSISTYCSLDSYVYPAEYIFTFAYYRTTGDPIYFYWWEDDTWQYEALETTTDHWIKHIGQYNVTGHTAGYNIAFVTSSTDQNIIIDEFDSWEANSQVRTTGYANGLMETGIFATMRNIDLSDNPAVPYHPVSVGLRDRSVDETIFTYNTITDEDGRIHIAFVLPLTNQLEEWEYSSRITSLITDEYVDSHFTPIRVEYYDYFAMENYTNYGIGGIDFTENWDDGATYTNANDNQTQGYNMIRPTGTVSDFRIEFHDINDIDADYYEYVSVTLQTNVSDLSVALYNQTGEYIGTLVELDTRAGELDWTTIVWNLTEVSAWSGTQGGFELRFDEVGGDGNVEADNFVWIDHIRLFYIDKPWLIDTATYGYLSTVYNEFVYYVVVDGVEQEYVFDLDPFLYDLTEGTHEINITPFLDLSRRWICYIPGETITFQYEVSETGVMKLIVHDQSGNVMPTDMFKIYIDDVRLYDNYVYFLNISMTFNLTITDLFDNLLYQNTTEEFEQFKEILITLYSVKIQNVQENPVWVKTSRGAKNFSEWVFSFEVIKYYLEEDTYSIRINYTSVDEQFNVNSNGTSIEYSYSVNKDTAIRISGASLQDIYNNILELSEEVGDVNISLTNQIIDVEITVNNTQDNITVQIVNFNDNTTVEFDEVKDAIDYLNMTVYNNTLYHTVHFALADQAGIGLPWETFKVSVNNNRSYDNYINNVLYGTNLSIKVEDFYDTLLLETEVEIKEETEIPLIVPVYWVFFKNEGDYPALVELERNGIDSPEFTVPTGDMFSMRLTNGKYTVTVRYQEIIPEQDASEVQKNSNIPKKIAYQGTIKVSAAMPTIIDVSTPSMPLVEAAKEEYLNVEFVLFIIGIIIGSFITYAITNIILRPTVGKQLRDPAYVRPEEQGRDDLVEKFKRWLFGHKRKDDEYKRKRY